MQFLVDQFGKLTVSLGGRCALWCAHCYVTAPSFVHAPPHSIDNVIDEIHSIRTPFNMICVSGDTDPFLNEKQGLALLLRLSDEFPSTDLMFTTRLVPSPETVNQLILLGDKIVSRRRLFLPCVSVITYSFPNSFETSKRISSAISRIDFASKLHAAGNPVILAVRPTFPFEKVSPAEVQNIAVRAAGKLSCALGEAFILDQPGSMALRLGIHPDSAAAPSALTFLAQPTKWHKLTLKNETEFARAQFNNVGVPYFLRSMSAVNLIRSYWNFLSRRLVLDDLDLTKLVGEFDGILP